MIRQKKVYTFFYSSLQANEVHELMGRHCNKVVIGDITRSYTEMIKGVHEKNNWNDCRVVARSSDYSVKLGRRL